MLNWQIELERTTYNIRFNPQNGEISVNVMPVQAVMKHGARGIQYAFMIGQHDCDIIPTIEGGYRLMVDGKPALKPKSYRQASRTLDEPAMIFRRRRQYEADRAHRVNAIQQFIPDWLWLMLIPMSIIPVVGQLHPYSLLLWVIGVGILILVANLGTFKVTERQAIAYMVTFLCWSVLIILMSRELI
ncbi:MAG: hypothetical protein CUN56_07930 [Phototrophicales bacterium]|nr:MAG: hypothetical protein CUN56_07930 [Phototrophicales bacterium]RMG69640.1 MAG: hypothetical protein D6711_19045 [Chloroflexota bacterium]